MNPYLFLIGTGRMHSEKNEIENRFHICKSYFSRIKIEVKKKKK
jgi:hypothetical protein